ncbi:MFS transporter [uncultured Alcanivorax sp.]|jgi:predicted MFS family arabinose efflux permease|uniref:MFS transporter n=1 Tax=uncultured Alcanivorax sp. TaxID=191215 RepID=UPI0030D9B79F
MTHDTPSSSPLSPLLVLLMATTTGLVVASNYYAQPLLHTIADQLSLSYAKAGIIVTTAQASYAVGLILLVPLGDLVERRRLIVIMMLLAMVGLLISASARSLPMLLAGTAMTGAFSVVAQVLVPFAATLAPLETRGKVVGTVMSGLLLGILLARTVAGALSTLGDWHTVYWVAAALMLLNTLALWRLLPRYHQPASLHYGQLITSIIGLFARHKVYRQRSVLGFLGFAMFSVLWTSLAFLLSAEPWSFNDATIGLFGLAGAAGALSARHAGVLADRGHGQRLTIIGIVILLLSWGLLGLGGTSLIALLAGIVLLDLALQAVHITNMNMVFSLDESARNRLNSGYMFLYFLGGAFGSLASAAAYDQHGWSGVVLLGAGLAVAALLYSGLMLAEARRQHSRHPES